MNFFRHAFLFVLTTICISVSAQVRVMSYNMLNFPTGNIQGRVDTLEKIVDYYQPHLVMIQELKTAQGLADATEMMNELGYSDFAHSVFVPQQSDPGNPYLLQQALIYSETLFTLKSQSEILTDVRDFNEFVLYLNDEELANGADTTFLYVYVTHLKSSEGSENQALRLAMVNDWLTYMNANIDADANVILAGDFNIYANSEDAYEALMDEDNEVVMNDVFASYGNWSGGSFNHKEILTQCTRVSQLAGDGASGGLDDRFDFILFSDAMMDTDNEIAFSPGTFRSLGNTGDCYNDNLTDCDADNDVPYDVLRAMYYMSDHIPQVCELTTNITIGLDGYSASQPACTMRYHDGGVTANIISGKAQPGNWSILDPGGRMIVSAPGHLIHGTNHLELPVEALEVGVYLFVYTGHTGQQFVARFVVGS